MDRPRHTEDLYAWALDLAKHLRAEPTRRGHEPIDWEELAWEVEIVAKQDRSAAASHLTLVIQHLLRVR